jgi:hypothetical protein
MRTCVIKHEAKVTPARRAIVERLEKGEKVRELGVGYLADPETCDSRRRSLKGEAGQNPIPKLVGLPLTQANYQPS